MSVNTFYNFLLGTKNTSSFLSNNGEKDYTADDEIDEDGFVVIESEKRQPPRCKQSEEPQSHTFSQQCETDTSGIQTCSLMPSSTSNITDIPMAIHSSVLRLESIKGLSVRQREYLDLDHLSYNFKVEIAVLKDTETGNSEIKQY